MHKKKWHEPACLKKMLGGKSKKIRSSPSSILVPPSTNLKLGWGSIINSLGMGDGETWWGREVVGRQVREGQG